MLSSAPICGDALVQASVIGFQRLETPRRACRTIASGVFRGREIAEPDRIGHLGPAQLRTWSGCSAAPARAWRSASPAPTACRASTCCLIGGMTRNMAVEPVGEQVQRSPGPPELYGTGVTSMPAVFMNCTSARCISPPRPCTPNDTLARDFLGEIATNSSTVFTPRSPAARSTAPAETPRSTKAAATRWAGSKSIFGGKNCDTTIGAGAGEQQRVAVRRRLCHHRRSRAASLRQAYSR